MQDGKALQAGTSHYLGTELRRGRRTSASRTARAAQQLAPHHQLGRLDPHDRRRDHDPRRRRRPARAAGDRAAAGRHPADAARQRRRRRAARLLRGAPAPRSRRRPRSASRSACCSTRGRARPPPSAGTGSRKGAPLIIEVGRRDMDGGNVSRAAPRPAVGRRRQARLPDPGARRSSSPAIGGAARGHPAARCSPRRASGATPTSFATSTASTRSPRSSPRTSATRAGSKCSGRSPTGAALDEVAERLKALKLTFRNVPIDAAPADGACLFTGEPAVERIFVARAY